MFRHSTKSFACRDFLPKHHNEIVERGQALLCRNMAKSNTSLASLSIMAGDILLKVDDKEVTDVNTLKSIMFGYNLGDEATLKINRNGKEMDVKIKFTSMNKN